MNTTLTFVFCCISLLVITLNGLVGAQKPTVLYTTSSSAYVDWYAVPISNIFKFKIRAKTFAINLSTYPVDEPPNIEFGLCHGNPCSGVIWRDDKEVVSLTLDKMFQTNEQKFIGYWVTWHNHYLKIGLQGQNTSFLSYDDSVEFPVNFIGVQTVNSKKQGIWIIENN